MAKRKKLWQTGLITGGLLFFLFFSLATGAAGTKIDLEFKNADLHDVLRTLADAEGLNIIIDAALTGRVTVHLRQITVDEAFAVLAEEFKFIVQKEGNICRVVPDPARVLRIEEKEGLLTVEIDGAPLNRVLRELAAVTKKNIIYPPEAVQPVVVAVYNAELATVLSILADYSGYLLKIEDEAFWLEKKPVTPDDLMVSWKNDLLTVDAKNVPIQEIAKEITRLTPISVVADNRLHALTTVLFEDVPLEIGLRLLCAGGNVSLRREGENIYRIVQGEGEQYIIYEDGLLSVDIKNAEITSVLEEIHRQTGINILYSANVRGPVRMQFNNLPLMTGLSALLEANGFYLEKREDHYYVQQARTHPNVEISYDAEQQLFSLEVKNAPLSEVLAQLAERAGENIVIFSHVTHSINNISLKNVTLEEAFDYLLRGTPFAYMRTDKAYLVGDGINLRPDSPDLLETRYYRLQYTNVEYLMNNLPPTFPRANVVIFHEQNALLVNGSSRVQDLFRKYLAEADRPENRVKTEVVRLNHLKAEEALKLFPERIPKTGLMVIREANAIAVTGTEFLIDQVKKYVAEIDLQNPQILFDVLVVQLTKRQAEGFGLTEVDAASASEQSSVTWKENTLRALLTGTIFPGSSTARMVKARLEAMVREGEAKLYASPQITTLSGYPATFNIISRYPRTVAVTTTVPAKNGEGETKTETRLVEVLTGIQVSLTPWISANRDITVEIKPKITESIPEDTLAGSEQTPIPATSERAIESTVRVRDGDPIIIGGLIQTQESTTENKIPLLGDLPLLGALFRYKQVSREETEFVIVITPHLISGEYSSFDGENVFHNQLEDLVPMENRPAR